VSVEIARAHGGDLSVVSSVGTGATLVLKLPLAGDES
jgi:signal transduction histidine kinase